MLIKLFFELEEDILPIDNKRIFISFFKKSCENYSLELYNRFYGNNEKKLKTFTFSIRLSSPVFNKEVINLKDNKFEIVISTGDFCDGIDLYNAFISQKNKKFSFNNNSFLLKQILLMNHKNISNKSVNIKMLSPLVVRCHEKDLVDKYLVYSDEQFESKLFEIVRYELKELCNIDLDKSDFNIKALNTRKTVVYAMGIRFSCSIGMFNLNTTPEAINALYQYGIGSRRSAGFGMFDIM